MSCFGQYVNTDSVYIEEIPSSVAKMIIEKHYTHGSMCNVKVVFIMLEKRP